MPGFCDKLNFSTLLVTKVIPVATKSLHKKTIWKGTDKPTKWAAEVAAEIDNGLHHSMNSKI